MTIIYIFAGFLATEVPIATILVFFCYYRILSVKLNKLMRHVQIVMGCSGTLIEGGCVKNKYNKFYLKLLYWQCYFSHFNTATYHSSESCLTFVDR